MITKGYKSKAVSPGESCDVDLSSLHTIKSLKNISIVSEHSSFPIQPSRSTKAHPNVDWTDHRMSLSHDPRTWTTEESPHCLKCGRCPDAATHEARQP